MEYPSTPACHAPLSNEINLGVFGLDLLHFQLWQHGYPNRYRKPYEFSNEKPKTIDLDNRNTGK
jgi:hypothetical protein